MAPTCLHLPTSTYSQYFSLHTCAWKCMKTTLKKGKLYYSVTITNPPFIIGDGFNVIHSVKISNVSKNKDTYCMFS